MKTGRGLDDLMNHLFASAEKLADPELTAEELNNEIERSKILIPTARTIIDCATLSLDAAKFVNEQTYGNHKPALPAVFTGEAAPKAMTDQRAAETRTG